MRGVDASSGKALTGLGHLKQSIRDILTTPIGTRVMRRDYGSRLFELVDAPLNGSTVVEIIVATAEALAKWEPRLRLISVQVESAGDSGVVTLNLEGEYLPDGKPITLEGVSIT